MTYEYKNLITGRIIETQQSIHDAAFTHYHPGTKQFLRLPYGMEKQFMGPIHKVKRLVSGGGGFRLKGSCWASDGYQGK